VGYSGEAITMGEVARGHPRRLADRMHLRRA